MDDHPTKRAAVYSLGGTIAMSRQAAGGVVPALSAEDLLAAVPGLSSLGAEIEMHDFRRLPGASVSFADLRQLIDALEERASAGIDGFVVTQGTDTIEETAYFLDLVYRGEAPIVVTGAMRNPTMAGADGPANILGALRVALDHATPRRRCMVVFADEIHAAQYVRKAHSTSTAAFTSSPGPIGYLFEDQVRFQSTPPARLMVKHSEGRPVRTAIATITLGDDGTVVEAIGDRVDGLVVAAFGAGHVPEACVPVLAKLVERMPVVLASRTGSGTVLSSTYGFPGSESDLLSRGLISAGSLNPIKARILLHTLLMSGDVEQAAVRQAFDDVNTATPHNGGL